MKRLSAALVSGLLLLGLLPSTVSADRVSKSTDHYVSFICEQPLDGGFASVFVEQGNDFAFAGVNLWFDPDDPMESEPTFSGGSETINVTDDGTTIEVHATVPLSDLDGDPEGDAGLAITMERTGEIIVIGPQPGKSNFKDKTTGTEEGLAGSGTLTWDGSANALDECSGSVADVNTFFTNPRAFVTANSGVIINCFWPTETGEAGFFAVSDSFGLFADASFFDDDHALGSFGESSGSFDASAIDAEIELDDGITGDPASATATATFTPNGGLVTSTLISEGGRTKAREQDLIPDGTLEFSTGDSFPMDAEHCDANSFEDHSATQPGAGPKRGPVPTNDTPDGAIRLKVGSRLNTSNVLASREPEIQLQNCPEGFFDQFGNTLWYTIKGTGSPITVNTAGSNFDTLIAVYLLGNDGFEEIACIDDVEFEPIGATFQAALTFDTVKGVVYYVQIGGYDFPFDDEVVGQKGRLRVRVN